MSVVRIFLIDVEWLDGTISAEAFESQSYEVLIGAGLLRGHVLSVDYGAARSVEIS